MIIKSLYTFIRIYTDARVFCCGYIIWLTRDLTGKMYVK